VGLILVEQRGILVGKNRQSTMGRPMSRHLFLFALLLLRTTESFGQQPSSGNTLQLSDLVHEVDVALLQVADKVEANNLMTLEKAVLEVNTTTKDDGHGDLSVYVVELGGSSSDEYASKVTLTLKPPPPGSPSQISNVQLADALRNAILEGVRAIKAAGTGQPPLLADELVASVHFAVTRDAKGGLTLKFLSFGASIGGGLASSQVQTITVTYKPRQ
jgi:hypothetical protein